MCLLPWTSLKESSGTTALEVKAPPVHCSLCKLMRLDPWDLAYTFWQSRQWHRAVACGSPRLASEDILPAYPIPRKGAVTGRPLAQVVRHLLVLWYLISPHMQLPESAMVYGAEYVWAHGYRLEPGVCVIRVTGCKGKTSRFLKNCQWIWMESKLIFLRQF